MGDTNGSAEEIFIALMHMLEIKKKKEDSLTINDLTFRLKKPEKNEQIQPPKNKKMKWVEIKETESNKGEKSTNQETESFEKKINIEEKPKEAGLKNKNANILSETKRERLPQIQIIKSIIRRYYEKPEYKIASKPPNIISSF